MREYMLYLVDKSIERMKQNSLISEYVYHQFRRSRKPPRHLSQQLLGYIAQKEKDWKLQDEEYLQFDSSIESGNLERVEAYPLYKNYVEFRNGEFLK